MEHKKKYWESIGFYLSGTAIMISSVCSVVFMCISLRRDDIDRFTLAVPIIPIMNIIAGLIWIWGTLVAKNTKWLAVSIGIWTLPLIYFIGAILYYLCYLITGEIKEVSKKKFESNLYPQSHYGYLFHRAANVLIGFYSILYVLYVFCYIKIRAIDRKIRLEHEQQGVS